MKIRVPNHHLQQEVFVEQHEEGFLVGDVFSQAFGVAVVMKREEISTSSIFGKSLELSGLGLHPSEVKSLSYKLRMLITKLRERQHENTPERSETVLRRFD